MNIIRQATKVPFSTLEPGTIFDSHGGLYMVINKVTLSNEMEVNVFSLTSNILGYFDEHTLVTPKHDAELHIK